MRSNIFFVTACLLLLAAIAAIILKSKDITPLDIVAPVTQITAPAKGSTVAGVTHIEVYATDNASVARVSLDVGCDGDPVILTRQPYTIEWDTTKETDGEYHLCAEAQDVNRLKKQSEIIVKVDNSETKKEK